MSSHLHYVGGYYSIASFIDEAQREGVSRVISVSNAKGLEYGDTVFLASWTSGNPRIFAQFRINRITLRDDVGDEVISRLIQKGRATLTSGGGGGLVVRMCGSYSVSCVVEVTCSLQEVLEEAKAAAAEKGQTLKLLVGGPLISVLNPPLTLEEMGIKYTKFRRGFVRLDTGPQAGNGEDGDREAAVIEGYARRKRVARKDTQLRLW